MKICQKCGTRYDDAVSFCPRDSEPLNVDHKARVGQTLDGQYEIEDFIAEGGMGAVFRARHTLLGDSVAIKILPPEMRHNTEWLRRFQREGQAARRFRHPNAVIVHDLRTSQNGEVYLVMEYVEGLTLDHLARSRGGRLRPPESLPIIEQVASVLDAAHSTGVVHRDLKPSNIMIAADGRTVKLLDLGIAKINNPADGATALTRSGQFLGTPYYMAPEQWGEMPRDCNTEIDGRADIYSLGIVVYETTAGLLPFPQSTLIALRHAHCKESARPLEEVVEDVPRAWSRAVERAMAKDRSDRQQTAGEFAHELRASLGAGAPAACGYDERAAAPTIKGEFAETARAGRGTTPDEMPFIDATTAQTASLTPTVKAGAKDAGQKRSWALGLTTSRGCQLSLTVAALALIVMAAGGYAIIRGLWTGNTGSADTSANKPSAANRQSTATSANNSNANGTSAAPTATASRGAFARYHLLISPSVLDEQKRAAGDEPIPAGSIGQFVFTFNRNAYLYVIGRDSQKNLIVIPLDALSGVKEARAGEETVVPSLPLLRLDDSSGTEQFTVIFSKDPRLFSFASETLPIDGSFRKLTTADRVRFEHLRLDSPAASVTFSGAKDEREALVQLNGQIADDQTVAFDIKISLKR